MTAALFKYTTETARQAALLLPTRPTQSLSDEAPRESSEEELEIARLTNEVGSLSERILALQSEWDGKLEVVRAEARQEAAREHVRNDTRLFEAIDRCLQDAREAFAAELTQVTAQLAVRLAATAVRKLAKLKQDEEEWIGRVIANRIDELAAGSLVAIHISSASESDAIAAALKDHVTKGAELKLDPSLPPGTARIVLRLGEIEISPAQGAARLAQALEHA